MYIRTSAVCNVCTVYPVNNMYHANDLCACITLSTACVPFPSAHEPFSCRCVWPQRIRQKDCVQDCSQVDEVPGWLGQAQGMIDVVVQPV